MGLSDFPRFIQKNYELHEWRHASAVLRADFQEQWNDIVAVLTKFRICKSHITVGGGGKSKVSASIDRAFTSRGWNERKFQTQIRVDENIIDSPTHKVDCFKGRVALELEWNNKDPFFDRDLNNFRLLFDLRAIDVGVIVTPATELQQIFKSLGKGSSYGNSTTPHEKLWPRIEGGGGGGCPVLTFAITPALYVDDGPPTPQQIAEIEASPDEQ